MRSKTKTLAALVTFLLLPLNTMTEATYKRKPLTWDFQFQRIKEEQAGRHGSGAVSDSSHLYTATRPSEGER